jgi:hypothetical protein
MAISSSVYSERLDRHESMLSNFVQFPRTSPKIAKRAA